MSLAFVLIMQSLALAHPGGYPRHGIYGAKTVTLDRAYFTHRRVTVASPDRRSWVLADGHPGSGPHAKDGFQITTSGAIGATTFAVASGPNQEMMWSPDSRAFFVTADNGGLVGSYELTVAGLVHGRLMRRDLTSWLATEFGHPVRCFDPEVPNVVGISWLGGMRRLLVAVQIPNHSNCDAMGTFVAYVVDPFAMRIEAKVRQREAKTRFAHLLGPALLSAENDCDDDAPKCWIPQLHKQDAGSGLLRGADAPGDLAPSRTIAAP